MHQLNDPRLVELDAAEMAAVNGGDDVTTESTSTLKPAPDNWFTSVVGAVIDALTVIVLVQP
jgi:hypothetical protein